MKAHLTEFEKRLCNLLQEGLVVCDRPFAEIADRMGCNEEMVLSTARNLKNKGVIRRIGAVVNSRALGLKSTLVTGHVDAEVLDKVANAVNTLDGVSHNYLREHFYNMWFTLQAVSLQEIDECIENLNKRLAIKLHSLPTQKIFKLQVRFDADGQQSGWSGEVPADKAIELRPNERAVLAAIQKELDITERPFARLDGDVLKIIEGLKNKGVIRRIGAIADHRKLGFTANVLFVSQVPQDKVDAIGRRLAQVDLVSHCYQRKTFEGWPYNLYAMMHASDIKIIEQAITQFAGLEEIEQIQLLPTIAELKKEHLRY